MIQDSIVFIPLLPLFGFVFNFVLGKKLPAYTVAIVACLSIFFSFILSLASLFYVINSNLPIVYQGMPWIHSQSFQVSFNLVVDPLSSIMINIITGIGFLIHVYSVGYMKGDPRFHLFFAYINLFCFAMLILVMADNLLLLFLGWEGVGLCSYLLIGFWFENQNFASAGRKAFVVNRIGDLTFLLAMFLIFQQFQTLNFSSIASWISNSPQQFQTLIQNSSITIITLLLFFAATGKSAQIPLYVWLPDAMAGPTPVSALIHAATMVTAGIYMIGRLHFLFSASQFTMSVILVVSSLTAFVAALVAVFQNDIKKVLAFSTVSQLGYMFMAMATGAFTVGIFHLFTHALFKALLFLGAGSVILACHHQQNMLKFGSLAKKIPITYFSMLAGILALTGTFPYMSGFLSKDMILEQLKTHSFFFWILAILTALLTSIYSFRLLTLTFWKTPSDPKNIQNVHESPLLMQIPLIVLALFSIFGGLFGLALFSDHHFHTFLASFFSINTPPPPHFTWITLLAILVSASTAAFLLKKFKIPAYLPTLQSKLFQFFNQIFSKQLYIDSLYHSIFVRPFFKISSWLKSLDIRMIDSLVLNISQAPVFFARVFQHLYTGYVNHYSFIFVLAVTFILFYYWFVMP